MRSDGLGKAGSGRSLLTRALNGASCNGPTGVGTGKEPLFRTLNFPVAAQDLQLVREHNVPIFLVLTLLNTAHHPSAIDVGGLEVNGLRDAQAGGIAGGQDYSVF